MQLLYTMCVYLYLRTWSRRWIALSKIEMHACIFIVANIYAYLVSEASLSWRGNRVDEYFLARTGNPCATFRARDTKDGREEALHGRNFVKFAVKGVTPSAKVVICWRNCFPVMFRPNLVHHEGTSSITYLDYYARLIGKIISHRRGW